MWGSHALKWELAGGEQGTESTSPSSSWDGWSGDLLRSRAALTFIRRMPSLSNRWLVTSDSRPPERLASWSASLLKLSWPVGASSMSFYWKREEFHPLLKAIIPLLPHFPVIGMLQGIPISLPHQSSAALLRRVACKGLTTVTSSAASFPSDQLGR